MRVHLKASGKRLPALLAVVAGALVPQSAGAYLSAGFIHVSGIPGGWRGPPHKAWIRAEGHYWVGSRVSGRDSNFFRRAFFSGPAGSRAGEGSRVTEGLVVSVVKTDPSVKGLMARCASKVPLPEVAFAESSDMVRGSAEVGERPAAIPDFFEYKLKNVQVAQCPMVKGAAEQAFVLKFGDIEWVNYQGPAAGVPLTLQPASLPRLAQSGRTKTFVLSWIGNATAGAKSECAALNDKPSIADYMTYLTGEDAVKARARIETNRGALNYQGGMVAQRGPGFLNICQIPGIVPATAFNMPRTTIAPGLDLDGDGGTRLSRPDVPFFRSYTSPDGRKGIDNQFFAVTGCTPGMQGRNGFLDQFANEEMRNGFVSPMLMISGIDDERNDDSVDITFLYSKDPVAKHASGLDTLPDYTFRLTNELQFTHYFRTLRGRIVNGVIETDPVELLEINRIYAQVNQIRKARLRLEIAPDGSLKGLIGGYIDWRDYMAGTGSLEHLALFQCPGLYQALKKGADGLKNPQTGEYEGISVAYELDGRSAFIPASQTAALFARPQASR